MTSNAALKIQPATENERIALALDYYYAAITTANLKYIPISFDLIILHELPEVPLYVEEKVTSPTEVEFKAIRHRGAYLSQPELDKIASNYACVYIERADVPAFTKYTEKLISEVGRGSDIIDEQKVGLLRRSTIAIVSDLFNDPSPENIDRGIKAVSNFVYVIMKDPKAYQLLLDLSSHDHYTLQHSVGVAANAIIVAKKIGINDEKSLIEVGIGGLLHDIGKTKVPKEIINKNGPLDEAEWTEMKRHALYGYEIIKENPHVGQRAKLAIVQHHEDANGGGYPVGLSGEQIDLFSRIVALTDIYNAITTDRPYSKAKSPFEACNIIKAKLSHRVDAKLFEALVLIYGRKAF